MEENLSPSKTRHTPIPSATEILEKETTLSRSQTLKSSTQVTEPTEKPKKPRKWRRVRRKNEHIPTELGNLPGVMKIVISTWVQKIVKCFVGEDVTSEYPWKYVKKEALEDNLELHEESSEFLPFKEEITAFPREEMLLVYIPDETRDYDEYYICLTEEAEEGALKIINNILEEREERLNNSVWKTVGEWKTLGSGPEVEDLQANPNRPLLEVEIETKYPLRPTKTQFRLRLVEQARDGYAEILCTRRVFANLQRKRIDMGIQVTPAVTENESQTEYYSRNAFTQYEYEFPPITELTKEFQENMQKFLEKKMKKLDDLLYVNNNIDFYKNDYVELVRDERYTSAPSSMLFKPYTSFIHPETSKGKEIICHSWHPIWSGIVAIAYAAYKTSDYRTVNNNEDVVMNAMYDTTPVLLWSFQDNLEPKLFLETYREITYLSWCPYNPNIIVGGCANGQVVLWDITDRLKYVEEEEILTTRQRKYRMHMNKFMAWMRNTKDLRHVRPTLVSQLEYSHSAAVTTIKWITPFREITKSGQLKDIPEEENRASMLFMSASLDGTVLAWDLAKQVTAMHRPQRKLRRLKERPSALTVAVSPYRSLNRIFKPTFKVNVVVPNSTRMLPITDFNMRVPPIDYVEKNPNPKRKFRLTDRLIFEAICKKPEYPCRNQFVGGSVEGDLIVGSWEGFDFNSGEVVNKEACKFENFARYHDGPIVSVSRSEIFPDLILTVGGRIFALWKMSFIGKPVMWRRSRYRYTHGMWNLFRPATFRLSRNDGYIEMWHLKTRSDRYSSSQFISREGLGVVSTHPRTMKQNILGMVGTKGCFEMFYVSHDLTLATEEDKWSTYKLCERELNRKQNFFKWQEDWLRKHEEEVKEKREHSRMMQHEREEVLKLQRAQLKAEEEELKKEMMEALAKESSPEPGHFAEWAHQQMLLREKERMMQEMLRNKHLDINVLKKNQLPLLKLAEEDRKKKANQQKRQSIAEKLFDDSVAALFPAAVEKKPPPSPDPYAGGDSSEIKVHHFEKYMQLSEEYETYVKERQYYYHFSWLALIQSGKERRRSLELHHNRYNHKRRLLRERLMKKKSEAAATYSTYQEASQTSLGSIDYEIAFSDTSVDEEQNIVVEDVE